MDPNEVRFTQNSIRNRFANGETIDALAEALKMGRIRSDESLPKTPTAVRLADMVENIHSREDFVAFVTTLTQDRLANPDDWENCDLSSYLEAFGAWVDDMDGFFLNRQQPLPQQPTWQLLGKILLAAKTYE